MQRDVVMDATIPLLNEMIDNNQSASLSTLNGKSIHTPNHFSRHVSLYSWMSGIHIQEMSYLMSRNEYLLLMLAFANIKQDDDKFAPIVLPLKELCKLLGANLGGSTDYKAWAKTICHLSFRGVVYVKNNSYMAACPYFSLCAIDTETQTVTMELNPNLAPYFLHLEKNKTIFNFGYIRQLSSANVMRLYTTCASMRNGDYAFYDSIEHLKQIHGYKGETKVFLRDVLVPGLFEINTTTDLTIKAQYVYEGKSISGVRFIAGTKSDAEMRRCNISVNNDRRKKITASHADMRQAVLIPRDMELDATKEVAIAI